MAITQATNDIPEDGKPSKLDEILNFIDKYTDGEGFLEPKYRKQAKSQILALIEEVIIGEDESTIGSGINVAGHRQIGRNQLRAQQRLRKDAL